jgi:large subunit ribosomal protein L10
VVIGREDAVAAAKVLTDFAKEFDNKPAVKLGIVERKEVGPEQVKQLAELPPREVLLAQLAGGLQQPMARLVGGMSQLMAGFARAVDGLRQQRETAKHPDGAMRERKPRFDGAGSTVSWQAHPVHKNDSVNLYVL